MANHGVLPSPAEIRELLLDLEVALDYGGLDPEIRNQPLLAFKHLSDKFL